MAEAQEAPYGLLARFETAEALVAAAKALGADGVAGIEAYAPYPVEGLADQVTPGSRGVALSALFTAAAAGVATWVMQWYAAVYAYPFVLGGKPLNAWPAFIPATVAMVMLFAVIGAWVGMAVQNRLPRLYHPAFNVEAFARASDDGFFLLVAHPVDADTRHGDIAQRLRALDAASIDEVPQ